MVKLISLVKSSSSAGKSGKQLIGDDEPADDTKLLEMTPPSPRNAAEDAAAHAIFDHFDADHTGKINVIELQEMCESMGKEMDINAAWEALKALDKAGDGMISFDEFLEWWRVGLDTSAITGEHSPSVVRKQIAELRAQAEANLSRPMSTSVESPADEASAFRANRKASTEMTKGRPERRVADRRGSALGHVPISQKLVSPSSVRSNSGFGSRAGSSSSLQVAGGAPAALPVERDASTASSDVEDSLRTSELSVSVRGSSSAAPPLDSPRRGSAPPDIAKSISAKLLGCRVSDGDDGGGADGRNRVSTVIEEASSKTAKLSETSAEAAGAQLNGDGGGGGGDAGPSGSAPSGDEETAEEKRRRASDAALEQTGIPRCTNCRALTVAGDKYGGLCYSCHAFPDTQDDFSRYYKLTAREITS